MGTVNLSSVRSNNDRYLQNGVTPRRKQKPRLKRVNQTWTTRLSMLEIGKLDEGWVNLQLSLSLYQWIGWNWNHRSRPLLLFFWMLKKLFVRLLYMIQVCACIVFTYRCHYMSIFMVALRYSRNLFLACVHFERTKPVVWYIWLSDSRCFVRGRSPWIICVHWL